MLLIVLPANNNQKDIWVVSEDSCFLDLAVQSAKKEGGSNRHCLTYTLTPCGIGKSFTVSLSVDNQSICDVVNEPHVVPKQASDSKCTSDAIYE